MGKPRMIILIRHAQSEGNKNREIHQMIPDHRVKLTDEGWKQAEEAGRRLRTLLKPDDTLQIFTSPYRRARETTEGILRTLTGRHDGADPGDAPSPFSRSKIQVYEEPRLREQDFGNFQPCSAEMERMWAERADYGHFFYRIPNGESAADAYDRVAGFNESLWRQFGDSKFPSVCVLVTHGLMTRIFLMKWYHWSVEYFEDLRNINHCEFVLMRRNNGKYLLESQLRTWSELKRQRQAEEEAQNPQRRNTLSNFLTEANDNSGVPPRQWGGCVGGCDHHNDMYPRRAAQRKKQVEQSLEEQPPAYEARADEGPGPRGAVDSIAPEVLPRQATNLVPLPSASIAGSNRDPGVGIGTPHERSEDEGAEYFNGTRGRSLATAISSAGRRMLTPEDVERWASESGMGAGKKADALGDEPNEDAHDSHDDSATVGGAVDGNTPILDEIEQAEQEDKSLRGSVY